MRRKPAGEGVSADDKKAAPNKKAGSDAGALGSAPFLCSDITDDEGASLK